MQYTLHPGENGPNLSEVHRATTPDDRQHDKGLIFFASLVIPTPLLLALDVS